MTSKVLTPTTSYMFYWMMREGTCGKNIYVCVRLAAWFRTIAILFFPIKNLISNVWYVYDTIIICIYIYTIYMWNIHRKHRICSIHIILQLRSKSLQHLRIIPSLQFGFQALIALSNDLWPSLTQKWVFQPRTLGCEIKTRVNFTVKRWKVMVF